MKREAELGCKGVGEIIREIVNIGSAELFSVEEASV